MKLGLIAKIIRIVLLLGILALLLMPVIGVAMNTTQGNGELAIGCDATYDVNDGSTVLMTESAMKANFKSFLNENTDGNYEVRWNAGGTDHSEPLNTATMDDLLATIYATNPTTISIYNADTGTIAHQRMITYTHGLDTVLTSGLIIPSEEMKKYLSLELGLVFTGTGFTYPIESNFYWYGNNAVISIRIPYIVVGMALAADAVPSLHLGLKYTEMAKFGMDMDFPFILETFKGPGSVIGEGLDVTVGDDGYGHIVETVTVPGFDLGANTFEFAGITITTATSGTGSIISINTGSDQTVSEVVEEYLAANGGSLDIAVPGPDGESTRISGSDAQALLSILKAMEDKAAGGA